MSVVSDELSPFKITPPALLLKIALLSSNIQNVDPVLWSAVPRNDPV
jgi:hypothetical protein